MANWLTHLRIAEEVMKKLNLSVDIEKYLVGSIATDSGVVIYDENGKWRYNPPRDISHWTDIISDWDRAIHYGRFYDTYVKNEIDFDKKSFYLGYYIHLITDAIWIELVARPVFEKLETHGEQAEKAKKQFRADLFDVDLIFLMNNPDFRPLELLKTIKNFENIYLDYFPQGAIQIKIEEVIKTYQDFTVDRNRIFPYCSYEQYEEMITLTTRLIVMNLLSR
jgi:hypothetical protein